LESHGGEIELSGFCKKGVVVKKLLKLALLVGAIAAVSKLVTAKKAEWQGLSEAEVREKLDSQLPGKMPGEKRDAVAEKVVSKMRDHGVLREEDEAADVAAGNGNAAADSDTESESGSEDDTGSV
jgi:hypothetical protein